MKWQYHVFKFSPTGTVLRGGKIDDEWLNGQLNELGADGWEARRDLYGRDSEALPMRWPLY